MGNQATMEKAQKVRDRTRISHDFCSQEFHVRRPNQVWCGVRSLIILERSLTPNTDKEKAKVSESKRLDWMQLWDDFRKSISTGKASWGKNEILRHMEEMEREMVRKLERELD